MLLRGVKASTISRGFVLASPDSIKPFESFEAKVYILSKKEGGRHKGFANNYSPQFFFRTLNVTGKITLLGSTSFVMPGDSVDFKVNLVSKVPISLGDRFVMREGNLTIGAGVITLIS